MHLHPAQHRHSLPTRYHHATDVADALAVLSAAAGRARVVAGGTDLLLELQRGVRAGIDVLVDVSRVHELRGIEVLDGTARVGAAVTMHDLLDEPTLVPLLTPLVQAAAEVGSPQLRNRATVVGNVVTASPANDTISALVALRASVRLQSTRTERVVPVEEFVRGYRTVDLEADELVVALEVPTLSADRRGLFVKLGNRAQQAISVVHGAIVLTFDGALVVDASIALGSVGATVVRVIDAERCLIGRRLDDAVIARAADAAAASVRPLSDVRATADYRTSTTRLLLRRALRTLATDASPVLEHLGAPKLRAATVMPPLSVPPLDGFGPVRAEVNGTEVASPGGSATLLDWLREGAGLTGTKEGCAEGECGACTVVMDGAAVLACLVPVGRAHGTRITTVEGLARDGAPSALQDAFVGCGAVQCGFCTPGFLVSGTVLLDERPRPRADDVVRGLAGNLCRCTGYRAIVDAVIAAAGEAGVR